MLQWMTADTEQMKEDGVRFLCRYAEDLGVPYKWCTVLDSLYRSTCDEGFLIAVDGHGQVRGAMAYTFGTGEDNYNDRSRIEVHLLYLEAGIRCGKEFLRTIDALTERELELPQPIGEVGFYCAPTEGYRKLFGNFATVDHTKMHPCGLLDFYLTTPERLRQYVFRCSSRRRQKNI